MMPTYSGTRTLAARPHQRIRTRRVVRPVAGQCFEITIRPEATGWQILVPEIDARTEAATRSEVELTARQCIATTTGIPLGYISVWVRD